jgi:hypothetical protein
MKQKPRIINDAPIARYGEKLPIEKEANGSPDRIRKIPTNPRTQ